MSEEILENAEPRDVNRGCFIPIKLIKLYEEGTLNSRQVMLWGQLNSIQGDSLGCLASNAELVRRLHRPWKGVKRDLAVLEANKLIEILYKVQQKRLIMAMF